MTRHAALALTCILWATPATLSLAQNPDPNGLAQGPAQTEPAPTSTTDAAQTPTLTTRSTLVLVPALVRNKAHALVFTLKAEDFALTDDGVPQKLTLEQDTGGEPLALVVDIEGGGAGADELDKYRALAPMLTSVVGGVPHKIAVVGFDSSPVLVQDFTPDNDAAAHAINALIADDSGDNGAAILDSLGFSLDLLRKQPSGYRRAILLVSETNDHGSKLRHGRAEERLRQRSWQFNPRPGPRLHEPRPQRPERRSE
jgi:hypothetical protein